ncbi:tripartite tricarboxylate transporter substrate binding protein [Paractinoplanes rishiriensis]|uniref:ABC transporter substrate-binding protein n=1 Tax=Paractinoplanes rishiriensis TaxID=1050105 RepID=A0A919JV44_9ACTN|nr:tripartite tricarboxylate transporter substrate binding protein [Actinoplanes rishiriensis]GIE94109.1 ABC transporter substrate-binding protein [Actinoplanes rishiriensis]
MKTRLCGAALAVVLAAGCGGNLGNDDAPAAAAKFPAGAITMLVGQDAGGSTDLIGRALADQAGQKLGVPVTVQNRPGANGAIAAKELASAKPDGQTVMVFVGSLAYITPLAVPASEAVDINDYEVVTGISQDDYVLVASPKTGFKSVQDMVNAKRPVKFGTTGVGTGSQLCSQLLFAAAGIQATAVPFDGGAPTLTAVLGGQVDVAAVQLGEAQAQITAKKINPIVTFAQKRPSYLPDTPTAVEAGYNAPVQQSRAIVAPKGTPPEVVAALRGAFQAAFAAASYQEFNAKRLLTPNEVDGATVLQQWNAHLTTYRDLVAKNNITMGKTG